MFPMELLRLVQTGVPCNCDLGTTLWCITKSIWHISIVWYLHLFNRLYNLITPLVLEVSLVWLHLLCKEFNVFETSSSAATKNLMTFIIPHFSFNRYSSEQTEMRDLLFFSKCFRDGFLPIKN